MQGAQNTLEVTAFLSAQCTKFVETTAFSWKLQQAVWLSSCATSSVIVAEKEREREREREVWGLFGDIKDGRGKIAHGVYVPEGESLAPVALFGTSCKHGACQEVSKPPRTMPLPWPSLGRRAGAMAWG